jgi:hypothetical protein
MMSSNLIVRAAKAPRRISNDRMQILIDLDQGLGRTVNRVSVRRRASWWAIALTTAVITMVDVLDAHAIPLTPFRYEVQAQAHCPADTVVWLNFRKRTYYSKGQQRYARGLDGSFVCRSEARASGYRRSLFGVR